MARGAHCGECQAARRAPRVTRRKGTHTGRGARRASHACEWAYTLRLNYTSTHRATWVLTLRAARTARRAARPV